MGSERWVTGASALDGKPPHCIYDAADGQLVAIAALPEWFCDTELKEVERERRARLIAAAPTLLAALEDGVRSHEPCDPEGCWCAAARAAIAAARGTT